LFHFLGLQAKLVVMPTGANTGNVLAFWQPRCRRRLADCDARAISTNLAGFIRVLLDWENRERKEVKADEIIDSVANGEDE
jgi:hypothetical protein